MACGPQMSMLRARILIVRSFLARISARTVEDY